MKHPASIFLIISLILANTFVFSQEKKTSQSNQEVISPEQSALMMTCYVCHNPRVKSHDDIIAPPLVAVKYRYKTLYPKKEDFVKAMTGFIKEPTAEKSIMPGPVKRFGPMPQMPLDPEQVNKIVNYLYDHEIEEPIWFAEHYKDQHGSNWEGQ